MRYPETSWHVLPLLFLTGVVAAQRNPYVDPTASEFGSDVAILSDIDGLGSRDLVVMAAGGAQVTSPSGRCYVISSESATNPPTRIVPAITSAILGFPTNGVKLRAVANVGDLDNDGIDEFAVSAPFINSFPFLRGEVYIVKISRFGTGFAASLLRILRGPDTFGEALAMVDTPAGRLLAVGVPGISEVRLFDPASGASPVTTPARTLTAPLYPNNIALGFSLAAGPGTTPSGNPPVMSVLAVGAPSYSNLAANLQVAGFVAIYDLMLATNAPTSYLYRGVSLEQLGLAVASVGFLPESPTFSSPRSDFVALGRSVASSIAVTFHTPQAQLPGTTPMHASVQLPGSGFITDGRLAAAGDVDSDGVGDFAVAIAGELRLYSTRNNALSLLATTPTATVRPGLTSGPDVRRMGATDVVFGTPDGQTVTVQPYAASVRLPNPAGPFVAELRARSRPVISTSTQSAPYTLDITGPNGALVFLLAELAPVTPTVVFGGPAFAWVSQTNATTLAVGGVPMTYNTQFPSGPSLPFLFEALIYQAVVVDPSPNPVACNGVLTRIGSR